MPLMMQPFHLTLACLRATGDLWKTQVRVGQTLFRAGLRQRTLLMGLGKMMPAPLDPATAPADLQRRTAPQLALQPAAGFADAVPAEKPAPRATPPVAAAVSPGESGAAKDTAKAAPAKVRGAVKADAPAPARAKSELGGGAARGQGSRVQTAAGAQTHIQALDTPRREGRTCAEGGEGHTCAEGREGSTCAKGGEGRTCAKGGEGSTCAKGGIRVRSQAAGRRRGAAADRRHFGSLRARRRGCAGWRRQARRGAGRRSGKRPEHCADFRSDFGPERRPVGFVKARATQGQVDDDDRAAS